MPERESEGASGASGSRGLGSRPEPFPTPGDWLVAIGLFYALAMVPLALFLLALEMPLGLLLEGHLGPLLLPRVGWFGWPLFLAPYGIAGVVLPVAGRKRVPILCGILVAVWLAEGVLFAFLGGLTA